MACAAFQLPGRELHHALQDTTGKVLVEYVWVGTAGALRSKTKVLDAKPNVVEEVPVIAVENENSFGGQAWVGDNNEVFLKPRKVFRDPFRGGDHILVLCDTFLPPQVDFDKPTAPVPPLQPHPTNMRVPCENVMKMAQASVPAFAVEQEYTVQMQSEQGCGTWPHAHLPDPTKPFLYGPQGTVAQTIPSIGGVAAARAARQLSEAHLQHCLFAGVKISGTSQGNSPSVWSYKLGPCTGVDMGDELWISRHLLIRVAEAMGVPISFDSAAGGGMGAGTGCYIKYSTEETRSPGVGLAAIQQHIGRLQATHMQHVMAYGRGSLQRVLSGSSSAAHSGPSAASFSCGLGNRQAQVMIPTTTMVRQAGYYVDRRPASNVDPYTVTMLLVSTTCGVPLPMTVPVPVAKPSQPLFQHHSHKSGLSNGSVCGVSGFSWGCSSKATTSMNTEDVLIDELDRMDGMAPDTPPTHPFTLSSVADSCDGDCCSDGTSPETARPLSQSMLC